MTSLAGGVRIGTHLIIVQAREGRRHLSKGVSGLESEQNRFITPQTYAATNPDLRESGGADAD